MAEKDKKSGKQQFAIIFGVAFAFVIGMVILHKKRFLR